MKFIFNKRLMILTIASIMCLSVLVFLPNASADTINVPGDYSTIQAAVNAANPGDSIIVAAGTYNEMVSINKPLTLLGANAGIHPTVGVHPTETVGTRGAETILSHNGLFAIRPSADYITIDGFKFTGTGGRIIDTYDNANYFSLMNCIFDNPGDHGPTGNIQFGGGSHTDLLFAYNIFIDGGYHTFYTGGGPYDRMHIIGNKFNGYGEAIFWAASPLVDAVVEYNEFDGVYNSVAGDGGAYMNIGKGGNMIIRDNWFHDLFYTGSQVGIIDGEVTDNIFERIYSYPGYWGTCFELWGGQYGTAVSDNVIIEGNDFYYNEISGAAEPTHGLRIRAPETGSGIDGSSIHVHDNNFYDGGSRTDAYAIWHQADDTVDATCNWWSDISGPYDPVKNPSGLGGIFYGSVKFCPWLDDLYPDGDCVGGAACRNVEDDITFCSIQAAIDASTTDDGETIEVFPGTHPGNIIVYKELTIESQSGAASTTIDASVVDYSTYQNSYGHGINYAWAETYDPGLLKNGFMIWADNVVIDGFKIINAQHTSQYNRGIGILIGSIHTTYAGFIPWNIDQWGGLISPVDEPTPTGVVIKNNIIDGASDGIYNWMSNGNTFEYNNIMNTVAYGGNGLQCYEGGTDNIIRGNTMNNIAGAGISICGAWPNILLDCSNTLVYDNTVTNSNWGIQFYNMGGSGVEAYNNNLLDNNRGIVVEGAGDATVGIAYENNLVGNSQYGIINTCPTGIFMAKCNWWGSIDGPGGFGPGSGDDVSSNVIYCPWLDDEYLYGDCVGGLAAHNIDKDIWYCCIQCAIDDADDYDTIEVLPGVFEEILYIDSPVTLLGASHGICKKGYSVPADYAWDENTETIIQPPAGHEDDLLVHVYDTDDVTIDGFIFQALERGSSGNRMLMHVEAQSQNMENINIINNIIGPNTNTASQDGNKGRMNLDLDLNPYDASIGITDSLISCNKIFDSQGNGDNIFIWGSYNSYGATGASPMTNTYIEDNEICGSHRCGIESAGGFTGLTIRYNDIHSNSGNSGDVTAALKYGSGILMIRGSSDKTCNGYGPENLLIEYNNIFDNEKMGIYSGPIANDITITCNNIYDNGWEGIMLDLEGQYWNPQYEPGPGPYPCYDGYSNINVNYNDITGNSNHGAMVNGVPNNGFIMNAECNWWGAYDGPSGLGPGSGDAVSDYVDFDPWIYVIADAGGPYSLQSATVHFDSTASSVGLSCGTVTYEWDFGDGTYSSDPNPVHTYPTGQERNYNAVLTITLETTCGKTYQDSDTAIVGIDSDPPLVQLNFPRGGEIVSGTITIDYYAIDDDYPGEEDNELPIYIYYTTNGQTLRPVTDDLPLRNDGYYIWDTTKYGDGEYKIVVEAVDKIGNVVQDPGNENTFTIDNGNAGVRVSDVQMVNIETGSKKYVKNGDEIEITAGITGREAQGLTIDDITADLSGFNMGTNVHPDKFDGFTATWKIKNIACTPQDGTINIVVRITGDDNSFSKSIISDNTAPVISISQPVNGIYIRSMRIFPLPLDRTIIFGATDVIVSADDVSVDRVEFYVEGKLFKKDYEAGFDWSMNLRTWGTHTLKIITYDSAGNSASESMDVTIYNYFGIDW